MAKDEYISNTRGARRYRFDEEARRKRNARNGRQADAMPFLLFWLLIVVAFAAGLFGFLWP